MSAKEKPTPGPWEVGLTTDRAAYVNKGGDCICKCDGRNFKANARLIAAVHDLAEVLVDMLDIYSDYDNNGALCEDQPDVIERAFAALAKVQPS